MYEKSRIFGNNIKYFLFEKNICERQMAEKLGYTEYELQKIIDARIFTDKKEKEDICRFLGKSLSEMYQKREFEEYIRAECMECVGIFTDEANRTLILDIFDLYCDMQEAITEQVLTASK